MFSLPRLFLCALVPDCWGYERQHQGKANEIALLNRRGQRSQRRRGPLTYLGSERLLAALLGRSLGDVPPLHPLEGERVSPQLFQECRCVHAISGMRF